MANGTLLCYNSPAKAWTQSLPIGNGTLGAMIYGTTDTFLRCFSLNSLDDLPPLPEKDETQETADEITDDAVSSEND